MTTYRVQPLPDGVSMQGNWQVKRNGSRQTTHTKKQSAENAARRKATVGDTIVLHRVDGSVQTSYRYEGGGGSSNASSSSSDRFAPTPFDKVWNK